MGNKQSSSVRKVFASLDTDNSGIITLDQILYLNKAPEVEHWTSTYSPLLLFRFDESHEGSLNYEEFKKMLDHIQWAEKKVKQLKKNGQRTLSKSGSFSASHVWTSVDKESASELDLSRDAPPPMIAGRRKTECQQAMEHLDEIELQELIRTEAKEFFSKLLETKEGRKQFLTWLFHLADVDGDNSVSPRELSLVLTGLAHDGIMPENLSFYASDLAVENKQEKSGDQAKSNEESNSPENSPLHEPKLVERIMREYDRGHTGYLSYDEFMVFGDLILKHYEATNEEGTIGKYCLKRKIGKGASGEVWLAIDTESKQRKAIKVIPLGDVSDMSRIDVEVKAMLMLRHPHIVSLQEVLETEAHVFFIMELCGGGNLSEIISAEKPLPEDIAIFYFVQVVDALKYCHSQGVCHRDLKLENLLLDNSGNLKVTDFGHAGIFSQGFDFFSTGMTGTITHLSPEQISGQCYSGEKIDIWTLGIVLYRMVVGVPPFFSSDPQEFVQMIQSLNYKIPEGLSPELIDLLASILKINPEERSTLSQIQQHPWCSKPKRQLIMVTHEVELTDPNLTPEACLKILDLATKEAIHVMDVQPPSPSKDNTEPKSNVLKMVRCIYPAKDLKFTMAYKQDEQGKHYLEFHHKDGETADLLRVVQNFQHQCANYQSESVLPSVEECLHKFNETEVSELKKTFKDLASQSAPSKDKMIDRKTFEEHFLAEGSSYHLPKVLADHIFAAFDYKESDRLDFEEFVVGMARSCKGTLDERIKMYFDIIATDGDTKRSFITKSNLSDTLSTTVSAVNHLINAEVNERKEETLIQTMVDEAFDHFAKVNKDQLNYEEFKQWAHANPQVLKFFEVLLHKGYQQGYEPPVSPELPNIPLIPSLIYNGEPTSSSLLEDDQLSKIRDAFSNKYWDCDLELLYKTSIHGYSLTNLYTHCLNEGPLLIVIKDSNGNLFGAFSSVSLRIDGNYYGDDECFLYTFSPEFKVFNCTHANTSFIKTTNHSMSFGSDCGLWLDSDIDNGKSLPSTTFGNTPLPGTETFKCVFMEVWALRNKDMDHYSSPGLRTSAEHSLKSSSTLSNKLESPKPTSPHRLLIRQFSSLEAPGSPGDYRSPRTEKISRNSSPTDSIGSISRQASLENMRHEFDSSPPYGSMDEIERLRRQADEKKLDELLISN